MRIYISLHEVCNGLNDCGEFEDEIFCEESELSKFYCNDGIQVISSKQVCDFQNNCLDLSDEISCGINLKQLNQNNCNHHQAFNISNIFIFLTIEYKKCYKTQNT